MQLAVEFGQCALPAGAGGAVVWGLLGERAGVRPAAALAAYACDRVVDLVFFAVAVPAVALWCWSDGALPIPGSWVAAQAGLALAILAGLARALRPGRARPRWRAHLPRRTRARLRQGARWARQAGHLLRDIGPVAGAQLMAFATAHWLARYSILAMLLHGLDAAQPWPLLFLVQTFALALAQAVPLPGGAGSAEAAVGALLAGRMDAVTLAAALLAWRGVTYHAHLLGGAAGWLAVFGPARGRVDLIQPQTDAGGEP
jgi:glycosyltransferase 2 family protein